MSDDKKEENTFIVSAIDSWNASGNSYKIANYNFTSMSTVPPPDIIRYQNPNEVVFTIKHNGDVVINPKYTVQDAAKLFWDEVIKLSEQYKKNNAKT